MSTSNISRGKGGRCVGLTTLPFNVTIVMQSGSLKLLENSGPVKGLLYFGLLVLYNIYLFTAIGFLPGGSGYFTCKRNMKLVTTRFKSGGLHAAVTLARKWQPLPC